MQLRDDTITSQKMLPRKAYRNDDDKLLKAKEDEKVFGGGFSLVSSDTVFYKLSKKSHCRNRLFSNDIVL